MKQFISAVLFMAIFNGAFSQTQSEMNAAEQKNFLKADKELNQVYQTILKEYKGDATFVKNLKASQRLWIQFMGTEIKMMYPDRAPGYYGSIHPMCLLVYKTELTNERIKKLRMWLSGQEEGNSCSSSVRIRP